MHIEELTMVKGIKHVVATPVASAIVVELTAQYVTTYGANPTATIAEIQKLYDDSEEGISATDIREFEGHDAGKDLAHSGAPITGTTTTLISPETRQALAIVQRDPWAVTFASKIAANPVLMSHLSDKVETDAQRRRLQAVLALDLIGTVSKADILAAPIPGLSEDDAKRLFGDNAAGAMFDVRGPGKGSKYSDVAEETAEGQGYVKELADLTAAIAGGPKPVQYAGWSNKRMEARKDTVISRRNSLRTAVKDAMLVAKRIFELEDRTHLKAEIWTEPELTADNKPTGKLLVVHSAAPVLVYYLTPTSKPGEMQREIKYMSVGSFLRADLEATAKLPLAASQFDAYKVNKGVNDKTGGNPTFEIQNLAEMECATAELAIASNKAKFLGDLEIALNKPENSDFRLSFYAVGEMWDRLMSRPSVRKLYQVDAAAQSAKDKAAEEKAA